VAHDNATNAPGLLQYHPNIHVWGPWKTLKRIPRATLAAVMHLNISKHLGIKSFEKMLFFARRLRELVLLHEHLESHIAVRLFRALVERERVDGASGLQTLRLGGKTFGRKSVVAFAIYVAGASSLETLELQFCTFKSDELNIFADGLARSRTITTLDLNGSSLDQNPAVPLARILRSCPTLVTLNLSYTCFGTRDGQLEALADAVMDDSCNLQSLSVMGNSSIAFTRMIAKLHRITTESGRFSKDGIRAIGEAIGASKTITNIGLCETFNMATEMKFFSLSLSANKSLQIIDLNDCYIDAIGLLYLKDALVGKEEIRELHLDDNNIGDSGCQYIAEILVGCPSIEIVHLRCNSIGSAGVATITTALPLAKRLQKLGLHGNRFVDDPSAAAFFAAVHVHPCLSYINFSEDAQSFQIGELARPLLEALKPDLVRIL
jgi:Ran GTPase-activating protein (RanGAP) involved in mRNA processing and transport